MSTAMQDIMKKSDTDLATEIAAKREEVRSYRFSMTGSAMRDVRAVRAAKKDIARMLTERNRRQREAA